jgi:hypothetical protein
LPQMKSVVKYIFYPHSKYKTESLNILKMFILIANNSFYHVPCLSFIIFEICSMSDQPATYNFDSWLRFLVWPGPWLDAKWRIWYRFLLCVISWLCISNYIALNGRIIDESWIGKDMEGSGHTLI